MEGQLEFFRMIFGRQPTPQEPKEWIVVNFRLSTGQEFGSTDERALVHQFTQRLAALIEESKAGNYDGDEYGGGQGALYMYGPDADRLFEVVSPLLSAWELLKGGHVIKRYGEARSEQIDY